MWWYNSGLLTCLCTLHDFFFFPLWANDQAFVWSLNTMESLVVGPEAKVVYKTLLTTVLNSIKPKPVEDLGLSILELLTRAGML